MIKDDEVISLKYFSYLVAILVSGYIDMGYIWWPRFIAQLISVINCYNQHILGSIDSLGFRKVTLVDANVFYR